MITLPKISKVLYFYSPRLVSESGAYKNKPLPSDRETDKKKWSFHAVQKWCIFIGPRLVSESGAYKNKPLPSDRETDEKKLSFSRCIEVVYFYSPPACLWVGGL